MDSGSFAGRILCYSTMVFSSAPFLFLFLPVVLILHTLIRNRTAQNALLIAASLFFYGYGEPVFVLVMAGEVLADYALARGIAAGRARKWLLVLTVVLDLGLLGVFKYTGFIVRTINQAAGTAIPVPDITLPIGISFFTFQVLSYVIDVYRDPGMVQKSFWKLLLYVSFFPQLIAGPIVKYHDVCQYIDDRTVSAENISRGMRRFVLGLAKKLLLANSMGAVADAMFSLGGSELSAVNAWLGAVCYSFQIFFDFSGYSDMAIGLGGMFGFRFLENFDHPYIASSMKEFWRRWHISLSTWFRDYLYIPLGGNRKGRVRTEINKLIVFFFTGMWHGASWNFIVWGMIHGIAVTAEDCAGCLTAKIRRRRGMETAGGMVNILDSPVDGAESAVTSAAGRNVRRKNPLLAGIGWLYTMLIVVIAFVFFRADDLPSALRMVSAMFTQAGSVAAHNARSEAFTPYAAAMFACSVFACFPVLTWLHDRAERLSRTVRAGLDVLTDVLTLVLLVLCILNLAGATYNPFIYFRF